MQPYMDEDLHHQVLSAHTTTTSSNRPWAENMAPTFTQSLKFVSVKEGQPAVFHCRIIANPTPSITWYLNNRPLQKNSRYKVTIKSQMHDNVSSLEIEAVRQQDSGSYKVFAINSEGSAESIASLIIAMHDQHNVNYLAFLRRGHRTRPGDSALEQKQADLGRLELRHVGSPYQNKHFDIFPRALFSERLITGKVIVIKKSALPPKKKIPPRVALLPFSPAASKLPEAAPVKTEKKERRLVAQTSLDKEIERKLQLLREAKKRVLEKRRAEKEGLPLPEASSSETGRLATLDDDDEQSSSQYKMVTYIRGKPKQAVPGAEDYTHVTVAEKTKAFQVRMEKILGLHTDEVQIKPLEEKEPMVIHSFERIKTLRDKFMKQAEHKPAHLPSEPPPQRMKIKEMFEISSKISNKPPIKQKPWQEELLSQLPSVEMPSLSKNSLTSEIHFEPFGESIAQQQENKGGIRSEPARSALEKKDIQRAYVSSHGNDIIKTDSEIQTRTLPRGSVFDTLPESSVATTKPPLTSEKKVSIKLSGYLKGREATAETPAPKHHALQEGTKQKPMVTMVKKEHQYQIPPMICLSEESDPEIADIMGSFSMQYLPRESRSQTHSSGLSLPVEIMVTAPTPTIERDAEENEEEEEEEEEEEVRERFPLTEFTSSDSEGVSPTKMRHKFKFKFGEMHEAPQIIKATEDMFCIEGDDAMFECLVFGDPEPSVTWAKDMLFLCIDGEKYDVHEGGGRYQLVIYSVTSSDAGDYSCVAKNVVGEVECCSALFVEMPFTEDSENQKLNTSSVSYSGTRQSQSVGSTQQYGVATSEIKLKDVDEQFFTSDEDMYESMESAKILRRLKENFQSRFDQTGQEQSPVTPTVRTIRFEKQSETVNVQPKFPPTTVMQADRSGGRGREYMFRTRVDSPYVYESGGETDDSAILDERSLEGYKPYTEMDYTEAEVLRQGREQKFGAESADVPSSHYGAGQVGVTLAPGESSKLSEEEVSGPAVPTQLLESVVEEREVEMIEVSDTKIYDNVGKIETLRADDSCRIQDVKQVSPRIVSENITDARGTEKSEIIPVITEIATPPQIQCTVPKVLSVGIKGPAEDKPTYLQGILKETYIADFKDRQEWEPVKAQVKVISQGNKPVISKPRVGYSRAVIQDELWPSAVDKQAQATTAESLVTAGSGVLEHQMDPAFFVEAQLSGIAKDGEHVYSPSSSVPYEGLSKDSLGSSYLETEHVDIVSTVDMAVIHDDTFPHSEQVEYEYIPEKRPDGWERKPSGPEENIPKQMFSSPGKETSEIVAKMAGVSVTELLEQHAPTKTEHPEDFAEGNESSPTESSRSPLQSKEGTEQQPTVSAVQDSDASSEPESYIVKSGDKSQFIDQAIVGQDVYRWSPVQALQKPKPSSAVLEIKRPSYVVDIQQSVSEKGEKKVIESQQEVVKAIDGDYIDHEKVDKSKIIVSEEMQKVSAIETSAQDEGMIKAVSEKADEYQGKPTEKHVLMEIGLHEASLDENIQMESRIVDDTDKEFDASATVLTTVKDVIQDVPVHDRHIVDVPFESSCRDDHKQLVEAERMTAFSEDRQVELIDTLGTTAPAITHEEHVETSIQIQSDAQIPLTLPGTDAFEEDTVVRGIVAEESAVSASGSECEPVSADVGLTESEHAAVQYVQHGGVKVGDGDNTVARVEHEGTAAFADDVKRRLFDSTGDYRLMETMHSVDMSRGVIASSKPFAQAQQQSEKSDVRKAEQLIEQTAVSMPVGDECSRVEPMGKEVMGDVAQQLPDTHAEGPLPIDTYPGSIDKQDEGVSAVLKVEKEHGTDGVTAEGFREVVEGDRTDDQTVACCFTYGIIETIEGISTSEPEGTFSNADFSMAVLNKVTDREHSESQIKAISPENIHVSGEISHSDSNLPLEKQYSAVTELRADITIEGEVGSSFRDSAGLYAEENKPRDGSEKQDSEGQWVVENVSEQVADRSFSAMMGHRGVEIKLDRDQPLAADITDSQKHVILEMGPHAASDVMGTVGEQIISDGDKLMQESYLPLQQEENIEVVIPVSRTKATVEVDEMKQAGDEDSHVIYEPVTQREDGMIFAESLPTKAVELESKEPEFSLQQDNSAVFTTRGETQARRSSPQPLIRYETENVFSIEELALADELQFGGDGAYRGSEDTGFSASETTCEISEEQMEKEKEFSLSDYLHSAEEQQAESIPKVSDELVDTKCDTTFAEPIITSCEVEDVTFGALYDYYQQSYEAKRPLSPESEMSIGMMSISTEDVSEIEGYFTPITSPDGYKTPPESMTTPSEQYHTPPPFLPTDRLYTPPKSFRSSGESSAEEGHGPAALKLTLQQIREDQENRNSQSLWQAESSVDNKVSETPPAFLKPLTGKKVYENGTLIFVCEVVGKPPPEVLWMKDRRLIQPLSNVVMEQEGCHYILQIKDVKPTDAGVYVCEATNLIGEAKSLANVEVLPVFDRNIATSPVTQHHFIEFDVDQDDLSRSPSPQEILLEVELDDNDGSDFEQVKIITIPEYAEDNKSMVISLDVFPIILGVQNVDLANREIEQVNIDVGPSETPPRFEGRIADVAVPIGAKAVFASRILAAPAANVAWYKDDVKISSMDGHYLIANKSGYVSLEIKHVSLLDRGLYLCKAVNGAGESSCRAALNISQRFADSGDRGESALDQAATTRELDFFVADRGGNQMSEIELEFEFESGSQMPEQCLKLITATQQATGSGGEQCVNVNFDVYAEASQESDIHFQSIAPEGCSFEFLITEAPPKFTQPLGTKRCAPGCDVSFECQVIGEPAPDIAWFRNDVELRGGQFDVRSMGKKQILTVKNVSKCDEGSYKCTASNSSGTAQTEATLSVG
ncbi:uncharacterized protein LOC116943748 [Petromyzon marinus]|uniref:uncharacterized protein LOC116943748 n=1 Tax=Petromyzon marinus TaxID=7757 RepID=UPI003F731258